MFCDAEKEIVSAIKDSDEITINKLTKSELIELGTVHGLELKDSMTKQEMIDAIQTAKETDADSKS